ncbi:sortase family protein [Bifidobacterium apri]|uniref:Sortase family protein n=2 Tax=Bifidobacterium apri TaxID=1769423 RepID=A0A6A2VUH3_9BIFI|nr:sortase family protein [Bifidobacterium apri]
MRGMPVKRRIIAMRIVAALLLAAAIGLILLPPAVRAWSTGRLAAAADDHERAVAAWPSAKRDRALAQAKAYNRWLAASGQPTLGVAPDSHAAEAYRSALATPDGVMGVISIPSIGVHLPIRHGTSSDVLSAGAGHLMGTSLPVGGASTHAVITAHRGLAGASMFTKLDGMAAGDRFSLTVLGSTMAYRVDRVTVIKPEDTAILRISGTEDRVTLMTCTPYGVNTHRLLVSGVRVPDATSAKDGVDMPSSSQGVTARMLRWSALAAAGLVVGVGIGCDVWRRRRERMR